MLRRLWICFWIMLTSAHAFGIEAVSSHAVFYLPDTKTNTAKPYIEVYWQADPQTLHYKKNSNGKWNANIHANIQVSLGTKILVDDNYDLSTREADSIWMAPLQTVLDLRRFNIVPGHLKLKVTLSETGDSAHVYSNTDTFTVDFPSETAYYSDIQLLDTFVAITQKTIFLKNDMQQIPLCTNFYDERKLLMHYYVELYNTGTITKENYPITQRIFISKRLGDATLFNLTRKDTINADVVCPFIGSFSLKALPSGNYYLNTVVEDKNKLILSYRSLFFQVINKTPVRQDETKKDTATKIKEIKKTKETKEPVAKNDTSVFEKITLIDIGKTFAIKYNLNQLKAILVMMRPIVSPVEMQSINAFLKKPDENYMRYFIYNHFSALNKKDPDAAWKAFTDKVVAVNKLFSSGSNMGYESDRGYVWLKYGKPDQRIEVPNESGALPYEVWQYNNIQGKANNVIFLFYQPAEMLNGYRLLHSTMVGELHNNNWRTALFSNGNSSSDPSSRVEQMMGTLGSQGNQGNQGNH